jgi:hypothetical protein
MKTAPVTASGAVASAGSLAGWSIFASAAAVVRLRKDGVVTGEIVHTATVATDDTEVIALGDSRINMGAAGTYVEVVSGTIVASLWYD